ncbi:GIY-YIG nuclease family protein, partial [Klebsiella pneumoniae]|nr:GIY-YIG nuclease family protein [Klebsiella pneumoniae]
AFGSFKRLWALYFELACLLRIYVKLGPRERWLRKLSAFLSGMSVADLSAVFDRGEVFCGVYAWVSVRTGKMYVGSTCNFRQRTYAHVRSM